LLDLLKLLWSRVSASVRHNGIRGAMESAAAVLEDARFDKRYGIETGRHLLLDGLRIRSHNKSLGVDYQPTRVRAFRKLLERLELPEDRALVDFGCGKGRVLIAAAAFGFRRITGVEFAPELCEICRRNLACLRARSGSHAVLEVIEMDAVEYRIRSDENVFFFYNPFHPLIMEKVMGNIQASLRTHPRTIRVIVNNPSKLEAVLESQRNLALCGRYSYGSSRFCTYSNEAERKIAWARSSGAA
jgi:precorrin-6B methylase 2